MSASTLQALSTSPFRVTALLCSVVFCGGAARADHSGRFDELLSQGKLAEAETEFAQIARGNPDDEQAKLAVGLAHFLQAVEGLAHDQFRYGLLSENARRMPIVRVPVTTNPQPEQISYDDFKQILARFGERLDKAEQSLSKVDTQDVKLSVFPGRVRFDIDGDGQASEAESLWKMFSAINQGVQQEQGEGFSIGFDGTDVHWLRGYCHVLMAFCDFGLAYDAREWFQRCGHLLYPDVDTPYEFLRKESLAEPFNPRTIADVIAAIHLLNFPLHEADKMPSAHGHMLAMIQQSRESWKRALAETDDDREWIPNPQQQGVIGLRVPREMIDGWHEVLDEMEAVLNGEKLIPFWRTYARNLFDTPEVPNQGTGINLKRFFHEPRDLDVVLFLTGTDATPYLEEGPLTTPAAWRRMTRVFQGEFFGFAIWFN
jgi:hypothetical protein